MQSEPTKANRDPLATLRIDRSQDTRRQAGFGRWLVGAAALIALSIGALWLGRRYGLFEEGRSFSSGWVPEAIQNRREVRVIRPVKEKGRAADATVVATGYLESRRQAKIGARAPGRVQEIRVEEGSRVAKDEILAVLEHADLDAALAATQAGLDRSKASILEQEVQIDQSKREYDRARALKATASISDTEHDQLKFQYDSAVARLKSMKADVQLAEARFREAEQLRENMFIRAPFNGTVISKDAEVGESILPGGMGEASGRGSAVTIADLDNLEVECDVKEDYISRIRSGQQAEISVDAVPNRRYRGAVRKIIPMGDRARATIKVKVTVLDVDEFLFPDMSCTTYFLSDVDPKELTSDSSRVFCPSDSVLRDEQGDFVWIVDGKSHSQKVRVTTGKSKDGRIEILSGLDGNERIIAKPPELQSDQAVKVSEAF